MVDVDVGVHLPLLDFGGNSFTLEHLLGYTETAVGLGFDALAVNDHLVFGAPWLDGPTALAAVLASSGTMTLATTVALPVVRGPVPLAKTLAAIDRLSGGRLLVAVGPGSSEHDYAAVGVDFTERWTRLDEAVVALRALLRPGSEPHVGRWYSTAGIELLPAPVQPAGPPIWLGSWGSDAGLRRVARLADGWLASAYNITPAEFARARARLAEHAVATQRGVDELPNALATMWCFITEHREEADAILRERVMPVVHRPEAVLRERLAIGGADAVIDKLAEFRDAGLQRVYIWPIHDERRQLELFAEHVMPSIAT